MIDWQYSGRTCHGIYHAATSVAVLNFFLPTSIVTITYRALDWRTVAVAIVEVEEGRTPTVQTGTMVRIEPKLLGPAAVAATTKFTTSSATTAATSARANAEEEE
eukprot:TRINITY_DN34458_c0_g1_i2.p2 TRINITY_DN34458_c0_g1~~TRINITY_DN34458_c0_g1_i2.p2  ORF type:complete len:105 (+),score=40.34 TRINITY_DN34458_c0_g1_i2:198-512(+)